MSVSQASDKVATQPPRAGSMGMGYSGHRGKVQRRVLRLQEEARFLAA